MGHVRTGQNSLKLFYCYAHEGKALRDALDSHLISLKRQKLIEIWYDGKISAGAEWEKEINPLVQMNPTTCAIFQQCLRVLAGNMSEVS